MAHTPLTIGRLLDILAEAEVDLGADAEVRLASQPHWPFEYQVTETAIVMDPEPGEGVLYLAEGNQIGYLPTKAREELGWA